MGKEELRFQIVLPVTLTTSITFYLAWHSSPCKGLTNSYKCLSWVNKSSLWEKHHISKNVRSPKKWNVITLTKIWSCSSGPRRSSTQITLAERPSSFPWPVPAFVRRRGRKKKKRILLRLKWPVFQLAPKSFSYTWPSGINWSCQWPTNPSSTKLSNPCVLQWPHSLTKHSAWPSTQPQMLSTRQFSWMTLLAAAGTPPYEGGSIWSMEPYTHLLQLQSIQCINLSSSKTSPCQTFGLKNPRLFQSFRPKKKLPNLRFPSCRRARRPRWGTPRGSRAGCWGAVCQDSWPCSGSHTHSGPSRCKSHCRTPGAACSPCRTWPSTAGRGNICERRFHFRKAAQNGRGGNQAWQLLTQETASRDYWYLFKPVMNIVSGYYKRLVPDIIFEHPVPL